MTAQAEAWPAALDAFERRLGDVADALSEGDPARVPPFQPPPDLGPLPPDLAPRAEALLVRAGDLTLLIEQGRAAVRARMDAPTSPARPAPARASRLDTRA